jgi:uncharacterized membrane protein
MIRNDVFAPPFAAAGVLGFALSGFFDGVLLHQILQWHHLLSLVERDGLQSLQAQILADGLFHALMYVVAVSGLMLLWRSRRALAAPGASRRLWGGALAGFGLWNVIDVGLFHWILAIHRVRLDVDNPLAWDMAWFVGLGLVPLAIAAMILIGTSGAGKSGRSSALVLAVVLTAAGFWNLRPPPTDADVLVLFRPGSDMIAAVVAVDARIVDLRPESSIAILRLPSDASAWALHRHGAVMVQGAGPSGCFTWTRPTTSEATPVRA